GIRDGHVTGVQTCALPISFRGEADVPNISLKGVGKPVFDARQAAILSAMYAGHHLQPEVEDGLQLRREVGRLMEEEMKEASRDEIGRASCRERVEREAVGG